MRRLTIFFALASIFALAAAAQAQETFSSANADYTLELPSARWKTMQEPDSLHEHAEFIYGDRNDGYLKIRKEVVEAGTTRGRCASVWGQIGVTTTAARAGWRIGPPAERL